MADFLESTLQFEEFPSVPFASDVDVPTLVDTKPRKILKARRLLRKTSEAREAINTTHPTKVASPERPPTVAFRAIQKSSGKNFLRRSVRLSESSFLENERLCNINGDSEALQDTSQPPLLDDDKFNGLRKHKLSDSTNIFTKKRRTLERELKVVTVTSAISSKSRNISKNAFKPKAMPNFARIFQVQSENTENIVEYKERKADRAAKLLSGAKPVCKPATVLVGSGQITPRIKKQLTFNEVGPGQITPIIKKQLAALNQVGSGQITPSIKKQLALNEVGPGQVTRSIKKQLSLNEVGPGQITRSIKKQLSLNEVGSGQITPTIKKQLTFTTEDSPNIKKLPTINQEERKCTPYPGKNNVRKEATPKPKIPQEQKICTPYPGKNNVTKQDTPHYGAITRRFHFNETNVTNRFRNESRIRPISSSTPHLSKTTAKYPLNQQANTKQDSFNRFGFKFGETPNIETLKTDATVPTIPPKIKSSEKAAHFDKETPKTQPIVLTIPKVKSSEKAANFDKETPKTQPMVLTIPKVKSSTKAASNFKNPAKPITETLKNPFNLKPKVVITTKSNILQPINAKPIRVNKNELVKAVLTKTRTEKEISSRRHEIKGVRLNRRFQLLMQMRNTENSDI